MLYYTEISLSHREVPDQNSICIYISGCQNRCPGCHYPELQHTDYGDRLADHYVNIIDLYLRQATCVCFLGEGSGTFDDREELLRYVSYAKGKGLLTCLYSGRDTGVELWMYAFDFVKVGRYKAEMGPLDQPSTNQRMFRIEGGKQFDITNIFWENSNFNK